MRHAIQSTEAAAVAELSISFCRFAYDIFLDVLDEEKRATAEGCEGKDTVVVANFLFWLCADININFFALNGDRATLL